MIASAPSPRTARDREIALKELAYRAVRSDYDRQGRIIWFVDTKLSRADQSLFNDWFSCAMDEADEARYEMSLGI